jgi:Flp pilus assembly pilin Flp
MQRLGRRLQAQALRLWATSEAQAMVEYAFILVLIALVVIVVLAVVGNQTKNMWCNISAGLGR